MIKPLDYLMYYTGMFEDGSGKIAAAMNAQPGSKSLYLSTST